MTEFELRNEAGETICRNCKQTLDTCDREGCGGRKKRGWRVTLIVELLSGSPKMQKVQSELITAVLQRKGAWPEK